MRLRIGHGYDVHQLVADRPLILGGVQIEHQLGLLGHSDADVLLHAICDAILGALGLGDIGKHFPDSDPNLAGVDSRKLLQSVTKKMIAMEYQVANIDATIVAERPKLAPYIAAMRENISRDCQCDLNQINVKATTTEQLGFVGKQQGIEAHCVALLEPLTA